MGGTGDITSSNNAQTAAPAAPPKHAIDPAVEKASKEPSSDKKKKRRTRHSSSSSRSRSRHRRRRKRRRHRRRSYSRSRSRSYDRLRSSRMWRRTHATQTSKKDMVWDGFQWHPKDSAEGVATKQARESAKNNPSEIVLPPGAGDPAGDPAAAPPAPSNGPDLGTSLAQEALKNFIN